MQMVVGKMLIYPNEMAVPLMPNFGAPPSPLGMLRVKVRVTRYSSAVTPAGLASVLGLAAAAPEALMWTAPCFSWGGPRNSCPQY